MTRDALSSKEWSISCLDKSTNSVVDIFFLHEMQDNYFLGIDNKCSKLLWSYKKFEIEEIQLGERKYLAPKNPEEILLETYGIGWKNQNKNWDSLINSPNITMSSRPAVLFYGLDRLHTSIIQGNSNKTENYFQALKRNWKFEFSKSAEDNIKTQIKKLSKF